MDKWQTPPLLGAQNPAYRFSAFLYTNRIILRILEQIWNVDERHLSRSRRWLLAASKRIAITVECILQNNITSYASALTYSSALAAVPILAIVFAVARGFGFETIIEERLRSSLDANPALADFVLHFVEQYLQHTRGGVFIGFGLIFLLYTLVMLTSSVETAFNTIWQVNSSRQIHRQVANYISVFLLLPFTMIIGSGISFYVQTISNYVLLGSTLVQLLSYLPVLLTCTIFVLLYKYMPNTPVRWRSALWPGIAAGVCFLLVQYLYIHYQIKLSSYNAIYGSFAAIPLFMLWLQISWSICLIGGQLSYAEQSYEHYAFERSSRQLSRRYRDTITLLLLSRISKRFVHGSIPYSMHTLAQDTNLPETMVNQHLEMLVRVQLLAKIQKEGSSTEYFLPAVDVHRMSVQMVMRRIESEGVENPSRAWQRDTEEWSSLRQLRNEHGEELLINL